MLEHAIKILQRVFEKIIRGAITNSDIQMGFIPGISTVDAIVAVRQLVEKYGTVGKVFFVAFIDLEKVFNCVPREVIWWALRKKGVMEAEVRAVIEMYQEAETAMQIESKKTAWLEVKVDVHQGLCSVHCFCICHGFSD